jgi:hypothetical protein
MIIDDIQKNHLKENKIEVNDLQKNQLEKNNIYEVEHHIEMKDISASVISSATNSRDLEFSGYGVLDLEKNISTLTFIKQCYFFKDPYLCDKNFTTSNKEIEDLINKKLEGLNLKDFKIKSIINNRNDITHLKIFKDKFDEYMKDNNSVIEEKEKKIILIHDDFDLFRKEINELNSKESFPQNSSVSSQYNTQTTSSSKNNDIMIETESLNFDDIISDIENKSEVKKINVYFNRHEPCIYFLDRLRQKIIEN